MKIQQELEIADNEQQFRINKANLKDEILTGKNLKYLERKLDEELMEVADDI